MTTQKQNKVRMTKKELLERLERLAEEEKQLFAHLRRLDKATKKRFQGRFVIQIQQGSLSGPKITAVGHRELEKYGKMEGKVDDRGIFWDNPGVAYTPDKTFCMVCGDTHTVAWIQYGIAPRFATCAKHVDFLGMGMRIVAKTKEKRKKRKNESSRPLAQGVLI